MSERDGGTKPRKKQVTPVTGGTGSAPTPLEPRGDGDLAERLVEVFMRIARGDLSARIPRNFNQDHEDAIAFFIEFFAEQIGEQRRLQREYEQGIGAHIEKFIALAGGDFSVRAERTGTGDPFDTMSYLLNNVADEVGELVGEHDRQRMLLETVLESMVDGVLVLDTAGRIRHSNGAMSKLLGRDPKALVGQHVSEILALSERAFAEALSGGGLERSITSRDTQFAGDGKPIVVAVNASPHRNASGSVVGFVLVARDDRELRMANAQLQTRDRLATMGTLAAGVAHEINNPLAFVSANIDFVLEEMEELEGGHTLSRERIAEIVRALASSREGATRVRNIVRDLHHFARAETETATPVDLNVLLDTAISLVGNEARHHARIRKDYGAPPLVLANEGRLVQVFLNLILNASQAIPLGAADDNEIVLATGVEKGDDKKEAYVEVSDTGAGIAEEDIPRVFDLFFTTKPVGEGMGVGLSISLRLVEEAGGRIEVRSKLGKGTTFRVSLPLAPREHVVARRRPTTPRRAAPRGLRVLVVDDEIEVGESVSRVLGGGHHVEAVSFAKEAVPLLLAGSYDVVLCDLLMPDMTGMEVYERVLASRPEMAQRMVFMTGDAFRPSVQEFLARVPNARVDKPFDAGALRAVMKQVAKARAREERG